jgi:hypothetical protein
MTCMASLPSEIDCYPEALTPSSLVLSRHGGAPDGAKPLHYTRISQRARGFIWQPGSSVIGLATAWISGSTISALAHGCDVKAVLFNPSAAVGAG